MARSRSKVRGGLLPSERRAEAARLAAERAAQAETAPEPTTDDFDQASVDAAARLSRAAAELAAEIADEMEADHPPASIVDRAESPPAPPETDDRPPPPEAKIEPATARPDPTNRQNAFPANVSALPSADRRERLRMLEALLFAASEPLDEATLARQIKAGDEIRALLEELQGFYASRGVNLVRVAGKWAFRTADDLAFLLERHMTEERRLSKAALETLSIIAYHQPVTRAEIEDIRGVTTSKGTLDVLMETGWVRPRGRRRAPGKPLTYGTTDDFLIHFGLETVKDLPGLSELKGAGLLDGHLPPGFKVPEPQMVAGLMPDELPLDSPDASDDAPELPLDEPEADDENDDPSEPDEAIE